MWQDKAGRGQAWLGMARRGRATRMRQRGRVVAISDRATRPPCVWVLNGVRLATSSAKTADFCGFAGARVVEDDNGTALAEPLNELQKWWISAVFRNMLEMVERSCTTAIGPLVGYGWVMETELPARASAILGHGKINQ